MPVHFTETITGYIGASGASGYSGTLNPTLSNLTLTKIPNPLTSTETQLSLTYNGTTYASNISRSIYALTINNNADSGAQALTSTNISGLDIEAHQMGTGAIAYVVGNDIAVSTKGTAQQMEGCAALVQTRAGTTEKSYGFFSNVQSLSTGSRTPIITNAYGIDNCITSCSIDGTTSTIVNAYGIRSMVGAEDDGAGVSTITNAFNLKLANYTSNIQIGGTVKNVNNLYQLYIEKPTWGSSINKAIYVAGGDIDLNDGKITSSMINNLDSDTNEVDSVTWAGGNGLLIATCITDANATAVWRLEGTTFVAVSVNALFTNTKDGAGTYNVYFETGAIKLQNKVGNNKVIRLGFYGV